jgi:thymidylate synthase
LLRYLEQENGISITRTYACGKFNKYTRYYCPPLSMRIIRAPSIGHAHELVIKMILEKGWTLRTEDAEVTIEFEEIALQVDTPLAEPMVSPHSRFQQKFVEQYAKDLLHGSHASFEYDYHGRLFDWGERLAADGQPVHIDQIAYIAAKLKSSPNTRRAIAITWNPVIDEKLDDCPCLQLVQCTVRDSKLHMRVIFRSNDMLTAAGANMYALVQLQKSIADQLGLPCGTYTHISLVPHIYYIRDMHDIEPFCGKGKYIHPVREVCRACGGCKRAESV